MAFGWPGKEIQGRICQVSEEVGTIFNSKQSLKTLLKSDTCDEQTYAIMNTKLQPSNLLQQLEYPVTCHLHMKIK